MAFRLKLVPDNINLNFFRHRWIWFGGSVAAMLLSLLSFFTLGLNFGIDFLGGTTIRTESSQPVDVGVYREALAPLELGDVVITEVFDPTFGSGQHAAMIRIQVQGEGEGAATGMVGGVEAALQAVDPDLRISSVESIGPRVSGELVRTAFLALGLSLVGIMIYVWLRFEWQFGVAAVAGLVHDVILTIGLFSVLQIRFDLTIVAALLTIVGYSINDTVVIFDRVREVLGKYRKKPLIELVNQALNETLSRTIMTGITTLFALIALFVYGGDVLRGFAFAMIWGITVGVYSTIFVASNVLLWLGLDREGKPVPKDAAGEPGKARKGGADGPAELPGDIRGG